MISEQEGCAIEELNAGKICDWFVKDKLKREQKPESAVLQWDDSEFQFWASIKRRVIFTFYKLNSFVIQLVCYTGESLYY